MIGVEIPTYFDPLRDLLAGATQAVRAADGEQLSNGMYCSQSIRGEVVGGTTLLWSRLDLQHAFDARVPGDVCPPAGLAAADLGDIKNLRQWAGPCNQPPDGDRSTAPPPLPRLLPSLRLRRPRLHDAPVVDKPYSCD
jgi:hypothetical protein